MLRRMKEDVEQSIPPLVETIIDKNIDSDQNTKFESFQENSLPNDIDFNCTKNKRKREKLILK